MRNIVAYPITLTEISSTLYAVRDEMINVPVDEIPIGSMCPFLLSKGAALIYELDKMIAGAPERLPVLPENPTSHDFEVHGAAQTEYAFAQMVRHVLDYRHE